jgi:hypothetical protein
MMLFQLTRHRQKNRAAQFDPYFLGLNMAERGRLLVEKDAVCPRGVPKHQVDILFAVPPRPSFLSKQKANDKSVDGLADRLIALLQERDLSVAKVAYVAAPSRALRRQQLEVEPIHIVQPPRFWLFTKEELLRRAAPEIDPHFVECVQQRVSRFFDQTLLFDKIASYLSALENWRCVLERKQPSAVVYYNMGQHYPLVHAANTMDIPTMEIQHGLIEQFTPLYNFAHWKETYKSPMHPLHFAAWSKGDCAHVQSAFRGQVHPFVYGHPSASKTVRPHLVEAFRRRLGATWEDKIVCVTLQDQSVLPPLITLLIQRHSQLLWLLKLHPKWNRMEIPRFARSVRVKVLDDQTDSCLSTILNASICHITRDSASTFEAVALGLPCFVYGGVAEQAFRTLIADGAVRALRSADDFRLEHLFRRESCSGAGVGPDVSELIRRLKLGSTT